ncbi:hypothetical protein Droror1_Dr00006955 [Drosera rotundifolia]
MKTLIYQENHQEKDPLRGTPPPPSPLPPLFSLQIARLQPPSIGPAPSSSPLQNSNLIRSLSKPKSPNFIPNHNSHLTRLIILLLGISPHPTGARWELPMLHKPSRWLSPVDWLAVTKSLAFLKSSQGLTTSAGDFLRPCLVCAANKGQLTKTFSLCCRCPYV